MHQHGAYPGDTVCTHPTGRNWIGNPALGNAGKHVPEQRTCAAAGECGKPERHSPYELACLKPFAI